MKKIYLDYAATSSVPHELKEKLVETFELYGNPSSAHLIGRVSHKKIEDIRVKLSKKFHVSKENILFTASGSEANNLVIKSYDDGKKKIMVSSIEHPSVMECGKLWGSRLIKIPFNNCKIDLKFIEEELKKGGVAIVSVMALNNETGLFLSIKEIGKLIKKYSSETIFHVDGVQSFGKVDLSLRENFIDYLTFSAHKIGGLKGCGGLISQRDIKKEIIPLISGGGQEFGLRSGTENGLSIISLDLAMDYWEENKKSLHEKFLKFSNKLDDLLKKEDGFLKVWKSSNDYANWIFTFSIDAVITPAVIVRMLSDEGIFISSGSACHSGKIPMNNTLLELGFSEKMAQSMLRVSFGWDTKISDVEVFYEKLKKIVKQLAINN